MTLPTEFTDLFRRATNRIIILGTNPLMPHLERGAAFFRDLLILNERLRLTVLVESDSENFAQALCLDSPEATNRASYATLNLHRDRILGKGKGDGWLAELISSLKETPQRKNILSRVSLFQSNLRLPVNAVITDETVSCCVTGIDLPTVTSYFSVAEADELYRVVMHLASAYIDVPHYRKFLSEPGDELIQMYDKQGYPRGIYPRRAFYTSAYQRYSIWGFVYNRRGQLLLHQRSLSTKDGRGLWDKSVGGHVDLRDSSTYITAQRELVEEMFLPEAEFTRYMRADIGDIIHFGDWNRTKRPERTFREALSSLSSNDWALFRATDEGGAPLTVTRVSLRRMHDEEDNVTFKRTVFRSDVFLFIAPPGLIDTEEAMKNLLSVAEDSGAAADHRLLSVTELRDWVHSSEEQGKEREIFTDDLLYINLEHRDLLETFAEFIRFVN